MLLCSHCPPISPLGRALAPHLCCPSRCFALAHCRILQPYLRDAEFGIVLRLGRHGGRSRTFCGKDEYRVSNNAPIGNVKRKIVEHIFLLKGKADLSDVDEKDMLDFLFTSQYHMSGIIAISLGRVEDPNIDNITHAVYMRFQRRDDLARFSANPHFLEVLKEHVFPYCYGSFTVDYESEVEDDMLSIFRRGEDFNYGVECILLISVFEASLAHAIQDAILALQNLMEEFRSLVVQGTHGSIFSNGDSGYTHAAIIRFPSFEAFELFRCSSRYKDIWKSKFQPITKKTLLMHFKVDPVGTQMF